MNPKITIEFEVPKAHFDKEEWWASVKKEMEVFCKRFAILGSPISITHTTGDTVIDSVLRQAEHASEVLLHVTELLSSVSPKHRESIMQILQHTS